MHKSTKHSDTQLAFRSLQVLVANLATQAEASQGVKGKIEKKNGKKEESNLPDDCVPGELKWVRPHSASASRQSRVTRLDAECVIAHLKCA